MASESQLLWWMNHEIPAFLDRFTSFEGFSHALRGAAASFHWKAMATAMAKERWKVEKVKEIHH